MTILLMVLVVSSLTGLMAPPLARMIISPHEIAYRKRRSFAAMS